MIQHFRRGLFTVFALSLASQACAADQLICCGAAEVFVMSAKGDKLAAGDRLWRWTAKDSPEIPVDFRRQFATTDECKPYPAKLLITSSSGGVALIERESKKCLFYTSARSAHSACLLPHNRVAVALSTGGDEMQVFSLEKSGAKLAPLAKLRLVGAHGAVWDAPRQRLWALGTDELLKVEIRDADGATTLVVEERFKLPTVGGHDLSPTRDERFLFVTTEHGVYRFDTKAESFATFAPLADEVDVKSIDEDKASGRIVYHQADHAKKTWWSDTIRFLEPAQTIKLPGEHLYKVRWNVAQPEPSAPQ